VKVRLKVPNIVRCGPPTWFLAEFSGKLSLLNFS
jgi:hypothetical protein